jgi:hypothetical protein
MLRKRGKWSVGEGEAAFDNRTDDIQDIQEARDDNGGDDDEEDEDNEDDEEHGEGCTTAGVQ